jgi:acetyl/propionyl-CoA carboxylase alpha subunit
MLFKGSNNLVQIYRSFATRHKFVTGATLLQLNKSQQETQNKNQQETPNKSQQETLNKSQQETPNKSQQETMNKSQQETPNKSQHETLNKSQHGPIRHNGAKKELQLKHKNSLFTLQTFHYNYY